MKNHHMNFKDLEIIIPKMIKNIKKNIKNENKFKN